MRWWCVPECTPLPVPVGRSTRRPDLCLLALAALDTPTAWPAGQSESLWYGGPEHIDHPFSAPAEATSDDPLVRLPGCRRSASAAMNSPTLSLRHAKRGIILGTAACRVPSRFSSNIIVPFRPNHPAFILPLCCDRYIGPPDRRYWLRPYTSPCLRRPNRPSRFHRIRRRHRK